MIFVFDKDNTLVRPASGERFPQHPTDQEPCPGARECIAEIAAAKIPILCVSNQGGIGKHKTQDFALSEFFYLLEIFPEIQKFYFAPGEGACAIVGEVGAYGGNITEPVALPWIESYRKPAPGMLSAIAFERHIEPADIIYCGDRESDYECARNFGCGFYWQHQLFDKGLRRSLLNSCISAPYK